MLFLSSALRRRAGRGGVGWLLSRTGTTDQNGRRSDRQSQGHQAEKGRAAQLATNESGGRSSCCFPLAHFGGEAAAVELDGYCVAQSYLGGIAEEVAGGVGGDGVAAFQDL